ncbi:MAG: PulJ/GspJ family protein [Actinomycetes bacterium]|jgi:prepilin-type N-terminal cleavage/methylation domain-containing protein|nr:prepilin-type N-terminal cleavage/methylation domain-containing protein [Candidatus Nanopelagicales bacterium]
MSRRKEGRRDAEDAGFSLIELIVAMGIFSLLMVIVGALTLSAFGAIRQANERSGIQTESQNAMEWVSRVLRYADVPPDGTTAIVNASPSAITVYTYAGTGDVVDAPYRASIFAEVQSDGSVAVVSDIVSPILLDDAWVWTGEPQRRLLLTLPSDTPASPLGIAYYVCDLANQCVDPQLFVPSGAGPLLAADSPLTPAYLVVSLGDPALPNTVITQTINLVNLA